MTIEQITKQIAPESDKTRRTREKLQKHWEGVEKKVTPEALKEKTDEIHRWIARHAHNRVPLRDKNISLFDGNENPAQISQKVSLIAQKIQSAPVA